MKNLLRIALVTLLAIVGSVATASPAKAEVDVYTTPGRHFVNGRWWDTTCEKYSITTRCRTNILATVIVYRNGRYVSVKDWAFNNLTYLPSPRSAWATNPLGRTGSWTATDGRKWRTECDTPATGRDGCRSYAQAKVITRTASGYRTQLQWVFNNIVRFSPATPPVSTVTFIDPDLEACMRRAAGLSATAPFTARAAAAVTEATCNGGVDNLSGLENFTGMVSLDLAGNAITSIAPLSKLTRLEFLDLSRNRITALGPLASLTSLVTLYISENPFTDVSALGKLPALNTVEAIGTNVRSVAPLKDARALVFLDLSSSTGLDASTLASLTQLRGLSVADSGLTGLTPLSNLKSLIILDVASNPKVTSATPLSGMASLSILSITSTGIGDLTPVGKLTTLTQLDIDRTPVQRVAPLATLTNLQVLSAVGVNATDWASLDALVSGGLQILR